MKKKISIFLAAALAASFALAACGDKDSETSSSSAEQEVYTAEELLAATDYDITEYVTLGDYENISVEVDSSYEINDENQIEMTNSYIEYYAADYYDEKDEAAEDGDMVNIDYVGTMDGEEFDGGSDEGYELVLGSDSFIDGFESGLVGHSAGETVTLNLTFPEDYSANEDYAGKDVTFEVTINAVYNVIAMSYDNLSDEWVTQAFADDDSNDLAFTTVDEFLEAVDEAMENNLTSAIKTAFLAQLKEISEITIPDELYTERVDDTLASLEETCDSYGITVDTYLSAYYGYSSEDAYKEALIDSLEDELVMEALVVELQSEVTSEEAADYLAYLAAYYGMEEDEFLDAYGGMEYLCLSYAEYYVALEEASENAQVTYVDSSESEE